ncbi:MAG: nucleotidyltransferase domain-containing protein [Chloroflexi bacterium]|nr:nucleotidyltransferase domain-containing protein [Chloroflexota bacterium]
MVDDLLDDIAKRLRPILQRQQVRRAIVFGSLARGDASRHSDLDLIIVQDTPKRFLDRYSELLPAISAVMRERDVDLLIYTPQEFVLMAERPFVARALREGKTIYESNEEPTRSATMV